MTEEDYRLEIRKLRIELLVSTIFGVVVAAIFVHYNIPIFWIVFIFIVISNFQFQQPITKYIIRHNIDTKIIEYIRGKL